MKINKVKGTLVPEVYIAVNKSRQKLYNEQGISSIYLENGTEFQLEFFNDVSFTVYNIYFS